MVFQLTVALTTLPRLLMFFEAFSLATFIRCWADMAEEEEERSDRRMSRIFSILQRWRKTIFLFPVCLQGAFFSLSRLPDQRKTSSS